MLGENGPLMKVKWFDAANERGVKKINVDNPSEHLCYCETIGEVVAHDNNAIVIVYHYTEFDGVDFICIPSSWVVEMEEMECLENLESQPESQNARRSKD